MAERCGRGFFENGKYLTERKVLDKKELSRQNKLISRGNSSDLVTVF